MNSTNKIGGIIYKATFENGKSYIGQTKVKLNKRISQHKARANKLKQDNNTKYAFYNAINKYGFDTIKWEQIDIANTDEELNKKEIYWISFYNTYINNKDSNGYNSTKGGQRLEIPFNLSEDSFKQLVKDIENKKASKELSNKYNLSIEKIKKLRRWLRRPGYYERIIYNVSDHANITKETVDKIIEDFKIYGSCRLTGTKNDIAYTTVRSIIMGESWSSYTKIKDTNFYKTYKKYGNGKYRFTQKQIEEIVELHKKGKKAKEIETLVNFYIPYTMILEITGGRKFSDITHLPHITIENSRKHIFNEEQLLDLYNKKKQGITEQQLMKEYNCSRSCIQSNYRKIKEKLKEKQ